MNGETIYALASGRGRAGIAVIRLSGPAAQSAVHKMTRARPLPRQAERVQICHPTSGEHLDDSLVIFFPQPASYTGEDVVELHVHGGPAVIDGVLGALRESAELRMAEPGEFTRRAFENGKMDLTAAEAVADLINAEVAAQRRQALRQGGGALARLCDGWRDRLVAAQAHWEAAIDFSDEDLPADLEARTCDELNALAAEIQKNLADGHQGERLRDGVHLAIIGPPNAGKSSLLNLLARRDVAIVSEFAGTTRDIIEVHLDLGGYPVIAADTAGIRDSAEPIEHEGVRRARARAEDADLRLVVFESGEWPPEAGMHDDILKPGAIVAINKIDRAPAPTGLSFGDHHVFPISVHSGEGVDALLAGLEREVAGGFEAGAAIAVTQARHREALEECVRELAVFLQRENRLENPEIGAEDLRLAARAVGRITGRVDVEDLLDVIFSDFCIGK